MHQTLYHPSYLDPRPHLLSFPSCLRYPTTCCRHLVVKVGSFWPAVTLVLPYGVITIIFTFLGSCDSVSGTSIFEALRYFWHFFFNMGRVGGGRLPLLMTPGAELKGEWQCGGKSFFFSLLDITLTLLYIMETWQQDR